MCNWPWLTSWELIFVFFPIWPPKRCRCSCPSMAYLCHIVEKVLSRSLLMRSYPSLHICTPKILTVHIMTDLQLKWPAAVLQWPTLVTLLRKCYPDLFLGDLHPPLIFALSKSWHSTLWPICNWNDLQLSVNGLPLSHCWESVIQISF